jgi:two-component system, cell cycle sensor histidine kinase and response regulator CckA
MSKPSDRDSGFDALRKKIIGLGERSFRKSHYPTLQEHLSRLERFRSLLDQTRDIIVLIEVPSGRVVDINESASTLLGYSREELLTKTAADLWSGEVAEFVKRHSQEDPVEFGTTSIECPMITIQGTPFPVEVTLRHARFDESIFVVAVARDVTDRKRLEEQLRQVQKMEAIGTLAGGVAHDFNNLLQVVLGYADMLLRGKAEEHPDRKGILAIRRAAKDGSDLVKGLLAFSRKVEIKPRIIEVNHLVKQVGEMLYRTIPRMIEIELILADDLKSVSADPNQMEQVLLNLAINARDAMPEGGRLTIETKNATLGEQYCTPFLGLEPGTYVELSISDTGHGMEKEVLSHIFEPFYTTKATDRGTGLGLAMVFGIVKSHMGHITCYSEPGMGTTFRIYLPASTAEVKSDVPMNSEMPAGGTETILLVDDDETLRTLGTEMLAVAGYKVMIATNGREALEVYTRNKDEISLVILDVVMPEMGGQECFDELIRIDPQVKILIASGFSGNGPGKNVPKRRGAGFIAKPFDLKQILLAVRRCLDSPVEPR